MSRGKFIDNLRSAAAMLPSAKASTNSKVQDILNLWGGVDRMDFWLTSKSVEGYDPADFATWPKADVDELSREVAAFRAIADTVPSNEFAPPTKRKKARTHLNRINEIVGRHLRAEWLAAQQQLLTDVKAAVESKGWYADSDTKELTDSLLGKFIAPRLRLKSLDREVVFNPMSRFGTGNRGVVDLVVLPTYSTAYSFVYDGNRWGILGRGSSSKAKPFTTATLLNTLSKLPVE